MSAAACGNSNKVSTNKAETETNKETESTPENNSESEQSTEPTDTSRDIDALKSVLVEAYMGLTETGEGVYYAGSENGEIGLLMFLSSDASEHYVFVGPMADNGNGTLTITDERDGITLTFSVSAIEDGVEIDMGDELGTAILGEATVDEVIDAMVLIENGTMPVLPGSANDTSYLYDVFTEAYAGVFADDMTVYIANNDDGSFMVVALLSPDMKESIFFIGNATVQDNYITVTDESTGSTLTFAVYTSDDGMILDMGDEIGQAAVSEVGVDDIINALEVISTGTNVLR